MLLVFLGATLLVRVLTDDLSSPTSRQSGSLDLSGVIAVLFVLLALGLLFHRRHGVLPTILAVLWLCVWTAIAVSTHGASTETLREGVREVSVVALGVVVYNSRGAVTVPIATRLVQLIGFAPALIALYQLAAHTGMDIGDQIRANGTFAHPDSAAMFFAIASIASLWQYLDNGRRPLDALLMALFAAALIATLGIDGLVALVAMLIVYGALRPGSFRVKLGPYVIAGVVLVSFFATPLGAQRIAKESSTSLAAAERGEANTSLEWRLHKWKILLPEWEASPLFGQGLGTTTTVKAIPGNRFSGKPPHNEYVRYLVETGIIGLTILLAALALLIRSLARKRRTPGTLEAGTLNAATLALAIVAGCLVNSLADNTLLNSPTCYAAALIVAAAMALPGTEARRAPARRRPL
jgi:O-antigen ligase